MSCVINAFEALPFVPCLIKEQWPRQETFKGILTEILYESCVRTIGGFGHFTFNPKFHKFWLAQCTSFQFGLTWIFGTSSEGGPLWPVWSFWLVRQKCLLPFDKIVVPSTALLYSAYRKNNQTCSGLDWVYATGIFHSIWHVEFPKFQTGIFVEWKKPLILTAPEQLALLVFVELA